MTHHSPRPNDADRLNTLLDALATGKRAPDAGSASDSDAFATVHRLVSGDADGDAAATPSEDTLDAIWRNVMQAPVSIPANPNGIAPPMSARQRARIPAVPERPRTSRFQTLLSMGAVAALLIVLIGAAWIGRGGTGPAGPEPGRYAAVPLDTGTPNPAVVASPEAWMDPASWEECTAEPMTSGEYVDIIRSDIDTSWRSYEIVGPPMPDRTSAAVSTLQQLETCGYVPNEQYDINRARSLFTDAYHHGSPGPLTIKHPELESGYEDDPGFDGVRRHFQSLPYSAYFVLLEDYQRNAATPVSSPDPYSTPTRDQIAFVGEAFNPELAVELDDGRIAIPATNLYRADDMPEEYLITLYVLAEEGNEWLIDEMLYLCFGQCDFLTTSPVATPVATPAASPAATPDGTASLPAATYVHPHPAMCTAEPLTVDEVMAILAEESPSGTPVAATPAPVPEMDEEMYEELRALLNEYLSCGLAGDPFRVWAISSPDGIRTPLIGVAGPWLPEGQVRQMLEELQAEIDAAPDDSSAFDWTPEGNPAIPALPDEYDPSLAYIGDDGRAYITVVWVTRDGDIPSEEYGYPIGADGGTSIMVFVWDADRGQWLIDGMPLSAP